LRIGWKCHDRIEGAAFIFTDCGTGRTATVIGYPTGKRA
jgi:hypothetical protein